MAQISGSGPMLGVAAAGLQVEGVSKRFGDTLALDDVSLSVDPGESLALLGPSGCGKTTLLRVIAGLERPEAGAGTVTVGQDLLTGPGGRMVPPERRRLGMVFQDWALFPHLSVARNVAYGLSRREVAAGRVEQTLRLVHLAHLADRRPHELSGGQAQRVALARALAPRPRVMLFDEAFSNLDSELRTSLRAEVASLMRDLGMTAVFVTHDQEEAFVLGDRVAVMRDARLVQCGKPEAIYQHPASPWVASFVGEANLLVGAFEGSRVSTAVGQVPMRRPGSGPCQVLVRPEHLDIGPGDVGVVESVQFYGHDTSYRVAVGDSTVLVRSIAAPRFKAGDPVSLRYDGPDSVAYASA